MKHLVVTGLMLVGLNVCSQPVDTVYTEQYLKRSTSFAATHFGADLLTTAGGEIGTSGFGPTFIPRLVMGGIHFWGHADFYVCFPLGIYRTSLLPDGVEYITHKEGIEVGAKLYPIAIKKDALRPFAGIAFRSLGFSYSPTGDGRQYGPAKYTKVHAPLSAGITYTGGKYLFNAGANYTFNNVFDYLAETGTWTRARISPLSFQVSFIRYIDVDKDYNTARAADQENKKLYLLKKFDKLSTWYLGVGPSAGLMFTRSAYFQKNKPEFYHDNTSGFMPDITFGRYFSGLDANLGISYRTMGSRLSAFETEARLRRHSFMLEGYKFLFNYLGFVPYLGVTASFEHLRYTENGNLYGQTKLAPGLIFGWDIRVTRTGPNLLRTNLRWVPDLHLAVNGEKIMYDHLEFNFIQYVHFFGRSKVYKAHRAKDITTDN